MIRAVLMLAVLAAPVAAQDLSVLEFQLRALEKEQDDQALVPLIAGCFLGAGDLEKTAGFFTDAGWARSDDAEMGMVSLTPPWGDPYVAIYENGAICDATSETNGLMRADSALVPLMAAAQIIVARTEVPSGCVAYDMGNGVTAELTSSGNDPQCRSDDTSNI